jgi:hypothetical protein
VSRIAQPEGKRGSLKWIQRCVDVHREVFDKAVLEKLAGAKSVTWRSPLKGDDFAEYRDGDFLKLLGLESLVEKLSAFWPKQGPQWDALGVSDNGDILLVEAKAHIAELCSPGTDAGEASRAKIEAALKGTIEALGAKPKSDWTETFYQYANRLAHLRFLREADVPAWLVLVNFVGDEDMNGPLNAREWEAAYQVVDHVLGINKRTPLMRYVLHVYPDVRSLEN